MNRIAVALRLGLYATFVVLLATGLAWEAVGPGSLASALMMIHGAAAMLALVLAGTLFAQHVPAGWSAGKNRRSGIFLLAVLGWLALTGYLLYYAGGESPRYYASQSHLWVGIATALIGALHVRRSALT